MDMSSGDLAAVAKRGGLVGQLQRGQWQRRITDGLWGRGWLNECRMGSCAKRVV